MNQRVIFISFHILSFNALEWHIGTNAMPWPYIKLIVDNIVDLPRPSTATAGMCIWRKVKGIFPPCLAKLVVVVHGFFNCYPGIIGRKKPDAGDDRNPVRHFQLNSVFYPGCPFLVGLLCSSTDKIYPLWRKPGLKHLLQLCFRR
ncbi:hypothetical protein ES703_66369 [subsurface metagenome]